MITHGFWIPSNSWMNFCVAVLIFFMFLDSSLFMEPSSCMAAILHDASNVFAIATIFVICADM